MPVWSSSSISIECVAAVRSKVATKAAKLERDLTRLKKMGAEQRKELQSTRPPVADDLVTTAIHIPKRTLALAVGRAKRVGGRLSVSALIRSHRAAARKSRERIGLGQDERLIGWCPDLLHQIGQKNYKVWSLDKRLMSGVATA